jgi:tetratricopeptide (TPR) repeat protein
VTDSDAIVWESSYRGALEKARRQGRLLVVHFMSPERPLSTTMRDETLSRPEVVRASLADFVNARLDARDNKDLFEKVVGGNGLLATAIVDVTEDVVAVLPGFADARAYLDFLETARSRLARLVELRTLARRQRRNAAAGLALGEEYQAMGSPRRADEEYARVLLLLGSSPQTSVTSAISGACHERRARLLIAQGQTAVARSDLELALRDQAQSARPDRLLLTDALVLSAERRLSDAAARLNELIQRFAASTEYDHALFALGSIEHELRDDTAALGHLEQLLRDRPGSHWRGPAEQQIAHIRNPSPEHRH